MRRFGFFFGRLQDSLSGIECLWACWRQSSVRVGRWTGGFQAHVWRVCLVPIGRGDAVKAVCWTFQKAAVDNTAGRMFSSMR